MLLLDADSLQPPMGVHLQNVISIPLWPPTSIWVSILASAVRAMMRLRGKGKAAAILPRLLTQTGSPQSKINYIRLIIMPIILYTSHVSNWSLKQYRSLDGSFTENYRKLLPLQKLIAEAIIYLPNKYYGISSPSMSYLAQKYNWNNIRTCQALG
jgi:hypothetical protein